METRKNIELALAWTMVTAILIAPALIPAPAQAMRPTPSTCLSPLRMERPPFDGKTPSGTDVPCMPLKLTRLSAKANKITDDQDWFQRNDLHLPVHKYPGNPDGSTPDQTPARFMGDLLLKAIDAGDSLLLIYGPNYAGGRYLVVLDKEAGACRYALDFTSFERSDPAIDPGYYTQMLQWAEEEQGILYISSFHHGYAEDSQGKNAYLTAIDIGRGEILWRSKPLIVNSANFEIIGDSLVCGYGFTGEPDYLYVLNRHTGTVQSRISVRSAPSYIVHKGNRLYVRTYNRDYVFQIE